MPDYSLESVEGTARRTNPRYTPRRGCWLRTGGCGPAGPEAAPVLPAVPA